MNIRDEICGKYQHIYCSTCGKYHNLNLFIRYKGFRYGTKKVRKTCNICSIRQYLWRQKRIERKRKLLGKNKF